MIQPILEQQLKYAIAFLDDFANNIAQPTATHNYKPNTARSYVTALKNFKKSSLFKHYKNKHYNQINHDKLQQWLINQSWSHAKVCLTITALRKLGKIHGVPFQAAEEMTQPKKINTSNLDTLYSEEDIQTIIHAPLRFFGIPPLQERNKAMFALVFANLSSLELMRETRIEDVLHNTIRNPRKPMQKLNPISHDIMQILHQHIQTIPQRYPHARVLPRNPLFFNPKQPWKPLTGKCIWQNMSRTIERLLHVNNKHKGSGEGLTALRLSAARVHYEQGIQPQKLINLLHINYPLARYLKITHQSIHRNCE